MCVASEATHGAVGAKQTRFFWVVVHWRLHRRANRLVLQGPASAMLFVLLYYYIIFVVSSPREGGSGGALGWRTNRRFSLRAAHTHTPTPARSSRLGSVSRRLRLLLSYLPPLPRRTDRRRENANDETNASALFTCGRTSRRWQRPGVRSVWFYRPYLDFCCFTRRPRGSEVALGASCGPSTQPGSTWREPVQTPRPSHLGRWSCVCSAAAHPPVPFTISARVRDLFLGTHFEWHLSTQLSACCFSRWMTKTFLN